MFSSVTNLKEIKKYQKRLEEIVHSQNPEVISTILSDPGGQIEAEVYWLEKYGIWASFVRLDNRYWNAFGLGKPSEKRSTSSVCEVNFAYDGEGRNIAGLLLKDDREKIYVAHRGRIGGGKKGIGKSLFFNHYRNEKTWIDNGSAEVALIGQLEHPRFLNYLSLFVKEVDRIKRIGVGLEPVEPSTDEQGEDFSPEFDGKKEYTLDQHVEADCDHGLIVNCLVEQFTSVGYNVNNDRQRDLFIINQAGEPDILFEVKTNTNSTSIYTALGQLLYHSAPSRGSRRVAVFPSNLDDKVVERIRSLGVEVLKFDLTNAKEPVSFNWRGPKQFVEYIRK